MLKMTDEDVEWGESLGEIFCLTFVRGVEETEALARLGALPDTLGRRPLREAHETSASYEAGYAEMAFALDLGAWTLVIEPGGFRGALVEPLAALSRGTEAVSVLRHDYADHGFRYAVDGTLVTGFEPTWPGQRWGSEPDRLLGKMRAAGLEPPGEDDDGHVPSAHLPALLLAGLVTGALPHRDALAGELLSAEIEPWFSAAPPPLSHGPAAPALLEALDAAPPHRLRAVAARETMRLAAVLGLDGTPGLADAVAAAERGERVTVSPGSDLGLRVRSWLTRSRQAGRSLNDPSARSRMGDGERDAAFMEGWFAEVVRAALWPDPRAAARAVLRPLTQGPPLLRDPAQEVAVLNALRGLPGPA